MHIAMALQNIQNAEAAIQISNIRAHTHKIDGLLDKELLCTSVLASTIYFIAREEEAEKAIEQCEMNTFFSSNSTH